MNHCVRLILLFVPSLVALALLGIALGTNWWTTALESNIPTSNAGNLSSLTSSDTRAYSTLVRVPVSRGLLSECLAYRNAPVRVSNSYDFRPDRLSVEQQKLDNETCSSEQFTCTTGVAIARPLTRCIAGHQKCDHIIDCEDKSDETLCSGGNTVMRDYEYFQCPTGYIRCLDGKTCYRQDEQTCDGVSNCLDDLDEQKCNAQKCRRNRHVYCPREGKCARRENSDRCDGIVDCADNSDEENCEKCVGSATIIACDSKCFPDKYRCDGTVQCSNLLDETNCDPIHSHQSTVRDDRHCMEQRFNPLRLVPPTIDSAILAHYPNAQQRVDYLAILHYLQLTVFYGIIGSILFIFLAIVTLFVFGCGCCRRRCISLPFYFYGIWMLLAWLLVTTALVIFVFIWFWQKQNAVDNEKMLPLEAMIHELNPSLQQIEFFGLSFWLACGATLATLIGLILSCCVCCTLGSARSEDKEYEIMQMQSY